MCSEVAKGVQGRCLLCNLGCEVALEPVPPREWRAASTGNGQGRSGLCARGQMIADLLGSPRRLYRPSAGSMGERIEALGRRLAADGARTEIWLDGNVPAEAVDAARALCAALDGRCTLLTHVAPHERGVVEGVDAAGVPLAGPEACADADALLIVGNPLATHPAAARHLLRRGRERANTPAVVVDSAATLLMGRTRHSLICRPGHEFWVVAALLRAAGATSPLVQSSIGPGGGVLQRGGPAQEQVDAAGEALGSAKRPAVVLAPQSGGVVRWRALATIAAEWAQQRGGTVTVLTQAAGAVGTVRCGQGHGMADWIAARSDKWDRETETLLVVGWDPSSAYPRSLWERAVDCAEHVVLATALRPAEADWVDELLPLALPMESPGHFVLADGEVQELAALMRPPAGVPSATELLQLLRTAMGASEDGQPGDSHVGRRSVAEELRARATLHSLDVPPPPEEVAGEGEAAVLVADPTRWLDGQLARQTRWAERLGALPELWVSPGDASRLKLFDNQKARVRNERGAADVRVVILRGQGETGGCLAEASPGGKTAGWLAINGTYAEVRRLAAWRFDEADEDAQAGTIRVVVEPAAVATAGLSRREVTRVGG